MPLAEDNDMVKAIPSDRTDEPSRLLKNWGARLTLEHEFDSCAVERAAGGIHARFGYTDR